MSTASQKTSVPFVPLAPEDPPPSWLGQPLTERLRRAMAQAGYVAKRGRNDFHRYDYATAADLHAAARQAFTDHGICVLPTVVQHTREPMPTAEDTRKAPQVLTTVWVEYRFYAADNPADSLTMLMPGVGADAGDKGLYKALTGSAKYMDILALLIPTGDDPEGDSAVDKATAAPREPKSKAAERTPEPPAGAIVVCTADQVAELQGIAAEARVDVPKLLRWLRVSSWADIPAARYAELRGMLLDRLAQ